MKTTANSALQFSLMFFASDGDAAQTDALQANTQRYDLALRACDFADQANFAAVWLPERHFHRFGGLYPNPAVLAAAIATRTQRLRIRAGSVILPLHDPIRVAEEWSMVDNLSSGRVDLGFGQGWNPNDFVLRPQDYAERLARLHDGIQQVRTLWAGGKVERNNGLGQITQISTYPRPVQPQFNMWLTCSGGEERFAEAGRLGVNVLTALLFQTPAELQRKIAVYREARNQAGHDPHGGHVTLMLHTFAGEDTRTVKNVVREPLKRYLADSIDLWKQQFSGLSGLGEQDQSRVLDFAFERYFRHQSLCGGPEHLAEISHALYEAGVNEIACLIDFGVPHEAALESLRYVASLARQMQAPSPTEAFADLVFDELKRNAT
jgi:natural product biosynthesis luciferase-like monooxygenase protein